MAIGASILLIATGAILTFAVDVHTRGVDLVTAGVILMVFGFIGLLASLVVFEDWPPRRTIDLVDADEDVMVRRRRRTVPEPLEPIDPVVERRRVTTVTRDGPPY